LSPRRSGIVVYGKEYFFGGGIATAPPGGTHFGVPLEVIELGTTEVPEALFDEWLRGAASARFRAEDYNLLHHNCNTFTDEVLAGAIDRSSDQERWSPPAASNGSPPLVAQRVPTQPLTHHRRLPAPRSIAPHGNRPRASSSALGCRIASRKWSTRFERHRQQGVARCSPPSLLPDSLAPPSIFTARRRLVQPKGTHSGVSAPPPVAPPLYRRLPRVRRFSRRRSGRC
jgi:hypothetical protein